MRAAILVCLLFVAGSCAMPQSEVAPTQDRMVDLWMINVIDLFLEFVRLYNLHRLEIERHDFHNIIINQLVEIKGFVENVKFTGLDDLRIHDMRYNIPIGLLNMHIEFPKLFLSIGRYHASLLYGNTFVEIDISGTLEITGIQLGGYAIIEARPGFVNILAINTNCRIDGFKSDVTVVGADDYSAQVNNFINFILPDFLNLFSREINNAIGDLIRWLVSIRWPQWL